MLYSSKAFRAVATGSLLICLAACDQAAAPLVEGQPAPHGKFVGRCAAALTKASRLTPKLQGAELVLMDPQVLKAGDTPRIQCAIRDGRGRLGAVTADIICGADLDSSCVRLVSAMAGNKILLLPKPN